MFRELRRTKQKLSTEQNEEILRRATSGVLALQGDDGYPYAVPLSFVYDEGRLYFHSAVAGHKIDALKNSEKATFCIIAEDNIVPSEFTTLYKSVIVFGRAKIVENEEEARAAMIKLGKKYSSGYENEGSMAIERQKANYVVIRLDAEHISGKQSNPIY